MIEFEERLTDHLTLAVTQNLFVVVNKTRTPF